MSRQRVHYDTVQWGGQHLVPVQYVADGLITLRQKKDARKLHRAGTVDVLSPDSWEVIQANKGEGLNLDPGFVRT